MPVPRGPAGEHICVIQWRPAAHRALRKLDKPIARRLALTVGTLAANPRPSGAKVLTGMPGALHVRVGGYRIVYEIEDDHLIVLVLTLGRHRQLYPGV
jgi:mRNA interferase RelE/StbE